MARLLAVWLKFAAQQRLGERVWLIPSQAIQAGPLLRVLSCIVGQDCPDSIPEPRLVKSVGLFQNQRELTEIEDKQGIHHQLAQGFTPHLA